MSIPVGPFRYGTLSRLLCTRCKGDTIHKAGRCCHCGSQRSDPRDCRFDQFTMARLRFGRLRK